MGTGKSGRVDALRRADLASDALEQFRRWFQEAQEKSGLVHPNAVCLSTVDPEGWPEGRIVLLKGVDAGGFIFYTNFRSAKALALDRTPRGALTFHWEALRRQVRVRGSVETVDDATADAYFESRPRGSQLGAWASEQSEPISDRKVLEDRAREVGERFAGQPVPRPPHWGGYRVVPRKVEFWQEGPDRLHDRFLYAGSPKGGWTITRLSP